jgi:S1-C subfamily serine protease
MCQGAPDQAADRSLGEVAIKAQLFDPYSAVIEWSPGPFVEVTGVTRGLGLFKRHIVIGSAVVGCGTVNSKNRMGGYVGRQWFDVVIQNGAVVQTEIDDPGDPSPLTEQLCQSLGFGAPTEGSSPSAPPTLANGAGIFSPELGADFSTLTPTMAALLGRPDLACAVVTQVLAGSAAEQAGFRNGDCITAFDSNPVHSGLDLLAAVQAAQRGKLFKVELLRAGAPLSLTAVISSTTTPAPAASTNTPSNSPAPTPAPRPPGAPTDGPAPFGATFQDRPGILRTLSPCPRTKGAFLMKVLRGGLADRAGIQETDTITSFNDQPIGGKADLEAALRTLHAGDVAKFGISSSGCDTGSVSVTF